MNVIATAGHVDHGKSTLVQRLTGMNPDRLAAERDRGLSIELGFTWTEFENYGTVAFVDVPGHERFISTMLSGIGSVGACLFIVAADDDWMPQAAEHLAALDALGTSHGVAAVTRSDLADPSAMVERTRRELDRTSLAGSPIVPVSAMTGDGIEDLIAELGRALAALPAPQPDADVRLWIDRHFTVKGAGVVVTGTLSSGSLHVGDELQTAHGAVRVRRLESLGVDHDEIVGPARVAMNITGATSLLQRGDALWRPQAWCVSDTMDVRVSHGDEPIPRQPILHIGSHAESARAQYLDDRHVRIHLKHALPVRQGDRALLRDPGSRHLWGIRVVDPIPPSFRRRGSARNHAARLATRSLEPNFTEELAYRRMIDSDTLRQLGITPAGTSRWYLSESRQTGLARSLADTVEQHDRAHPEDPGIPVQVLTRQLNLPSSSIIEALVKPPLTLAEGRVFAQPAITLPATAESGFRILSTDLADNPFAAPTLERIREIGLSPKDLSALQRAGLIVQPAPGVVLRADAVQRATVLLGELPEPFTVSDARQRWQTSRRVAIPLLTLLDRLRITKRFADDTRILLPRER